VLHDIYTPQRRDILEKAAEIILSVTGGYALRHLAILAKTIATSKRDCLARKISAGAEWRLPGRVKCTTLLHSWQASAAVDLRIRTPGQEIRMISHDARPRSS
jgi:hypothetical protein